VKPSAGDGSGRCPVAGCRFRSDLLDARQHFLANQHAFSWQTAYRLAEPVAVRKGTKLTWTGWWDNSADNPRNPDATKTVRWGLQTTDEMQNGWMELVWQKGKDRP
jgi:hypothetical protein